MLNNVIRETIRKLVIDGHSAEIRALLLNSNQLDLVARVKRVDTLRASLLSHSDGVSIQNASSKLNRLYSTGYLKRTETSADSGGLEYFYSIAENN
jgi:hypothetical protein